MSAKSSLLTTGAFLGGGFGGMLAGGSILAGTTLGAFGGPIGAAAGLGVALWVKSQAHWKANEWTKGYQTQWGDKAIAFMDDLTARRKAGTLTYDDALKAQNEFNSNVADFWDQGALFSAKGGDQKTVIDNAHRKLDPIIAGWKTSLQESITALAPASDPSATDTTAPTMPADTNQRAEAAADLEKKHQLGMKGRSSTILTGPSGLKNERKEQQKTLLAL